MNGKLERFYGVYDGKRAQFKTLEEYVHWQNEVKPHLSLDFERLETPIQAFHRKKPPQQANTPAEKDVVK
jgi:putative transposase